MTGKPSAGLRQRKEGEFGRGGGSPQFVVVGFSPLQIVFLYQLVSLVGQRPWK